MNKTLSNFSPLIQTIIKYFSNQDISLQKLADEQDISKQAVHKQVQKGSAFFELYAKKSPQINPVELARLKEKVQRLTELVAHLRRQLIIATTLIKTLLWLKENNFESSWTRTDKIRFNY